MLDIAGTVVAALVGIVGLSQLGLRLRARAVADVREVADFMRRMFGDVIAHGEVVAQDFMTEEARGTETRLGDLRHQVRDKRLRERLDDLMDCWKRAFANAPSRVPRVRWMDATSASSTTDTPERLAQVRRHVQAARDGQAAVTAVLRRCDALQHWIV